MMSIMVLVGLLAAHLSGQANMLAPTWLWLAAFASLMGLQATFTGFCPASKMLGDKSNGCCGS
jgi:hypothetical protein